MSIPQDEALRHLADRLRLQREVDREILAASNPSEIAAAAINGLKSLVGFTRASVTLFDSQAEEATILAVSAKNVTRLVAGHRFPLAVLPLDKLKQGEITLVDDLRQIAHPSPLELLLLVEGVIVYLNVPLVTREGLVGTLNLGFDRTGSFTEEHLQVIREVAVSLATALQNAHLLASMERRVEELQVLHAVSTAANQASTVDGLITEATRIIGERLFPDNFGVLILDEARSVLVNHLSYQETGNRQPIKISLSMGITGMVAVNGKPFRSGDVSRIPHYIEVDDRIHSELCVPLISGQRVIGVINTESTQFDRYSEADERLLITLATQLGMAIDRMGSKESEQRQRLIAETLQRVSGALASTLDFDQILDFILEYIQQFVNYDTVSVLLMENDQFRTVAQRGWSPPVLARSLPAAQAHFIEPLLAEWLPQIVSDVNEVATWGPFFGPTNTRSWLGVPLVSKESLIGILSFGSEQVGGFNPRAASQVITFANHAALALETAQLYHSAQSRIKRLNAMTRIANLLNSSPYIRDVLGDVLRETLHALDLNSGWIYMTEGSGYELSAYENLPIPTSDFEALIVGGEACSCHLNLVNDGISEKIDIVECSLLRGLGFSSTASHHICVPIRAGKEVFGMMNLYLPSPDFLLGADDQATLSGIGHQLAVALSRSRFYQETRAHASLTEQLVAMGEKLNRPLTPPEVLDAIGQGGSQLGRTSRLAIYVRHPDDSVTCPWYQGLSSSYIQQILANLSNIPGGGMLQSVQEIIIPDIMQLPEQTVLRRLATEEKCRAIALFPMVYENRVIAALGCYYDQPRTWLDTEKSLVQTFARQAAVAMENARLFTVTQRNLQRLQALHAIDTSITANADLRVTLNVLINQVVAQLGVDAADILLLNPEMQSLYYAAGVGFRSFERYRPSVLRLGVGFAGQAALQRRRIGFGKLDELPHGIDPPKVFFDDKFVAYFGIPLLAKGQVKGVLEVYHRTPLNPDNDWFDFLQALADLAAIAVDDAQLFADLQRSNAELILAYDSTLEGWVHALDLRDHETEGHSQRVTETTIKLARSMGVSETELVHIRRGALLHDIGKLAIPDRILLKPGPLTEDEWKVVQKHPEYAFEMLAPIEYLRPALDIPYCHHEHWDGSGYPRRLKGEQIPMPSRIFTVVDVWDALRSDRPYRSAWNDDQVHNYIVDNIGILFDPKVVGAFLDLASR